MISRVDPLADFDHWIDHVSFSHAQCRLAICFRREMKNKRLAILMRARMASPTHPVHRQQLLRPDLPPLPPQGATCSGDADDDGSNTGARRDYDVDRARVCELMRQMERNLRNALKATYAGFFERLNAHPGGLKLLTVLRADLLSLLV
ncbi:hypothetical protein B296_00043095 [Ensete ventricosum]|uniref:Malonyl-CoA decarboxylase N-terminal domain-containing protein n=1 Tax=Ensete ventricosum TaxID=4639 RepID=A0A426XHG8_ENSVE|nr:hypothetical protein B296_00043095 [Ensete ventricosum]